MPIVAAQDPNRPAGSLISGAGDGNARAILLGGNAAAYAADGGAVGDMPATRPGVSDEQTAELKRRVVLLALTIGGMAVVVHLAGYIIGIAEVEGAIEEVRRVAPHNIEKHLKDLPSASMMLIAGTPRVMFSIGLSLLVPLCGYFGVKNSDSRLMCCFCGCNLLFASCSAIMVVLLVSVYGAMDSLEPTVESLLDQCDPELCLQYENEHQVIDCLAGTDRNMKFNQIFHLPAVCPQIFLRCQVDDVDPCFQPISTMQCSDPARRSFCDDMDDSGDLCGFTGKCMMEFGTCLPAGLPTDPTKDCKVMEEGVEAIKALRRLAPVLIPRLAQMLIVKLILTIPGIIVGCLGFCWGNSLYQKLSAGYAHMEQPAHFSTQGNFAQPGNQQQQFQRQPQGRASNSVQAVQGVVVPVPPGGASFAPSAPTNQQHE